MQVLDSGTYSEFSHVIHTEVNAARIPVNGTIEVTNRCPLNCSHCYNNLPMADATARRYELSTEDHYRVLDELSEMGCLWLLYSGGEIFARRDFLDIYTYAKKKGFLITLFTNGTLITEEIADYLVQWMPFAIEITLYGATRETYEALTRIPGSYDHCMRGIRLLLERGLPLKLKTVAVSINRHEIQAMRQIADDLGVEFKFDGMINPRIDCSSSPLAVRLAPHELVELDMHDSQRVAEWRRVASELESEVPPEGETPQLYDCGGGVNSFAIDPYGNLTICVLSHIDRYNLRSGSVRDGWEHFMATVRDKRATRPTKCTACALKGLCGMCPANGELENGDPEAPVEFLCHTAHLRAMTFGIAVRPHGACAYCEGGHSHEAVRDAAAALRSGSAERIAAIEAMPAVASSAPGCSSGGCTSCSLASQVR
ncbi:MAG TPA: radical SAM protein [Thermoanaerobaculia bacterium]|nr:radical SAM protein [Thermoanaerobaculia bacterium]